MSDKEHSHKGAGHFSRDSQSASTSADRNKSADALPASRIKKKETPPHLLCDRCQAICDFAIRTRFFVIIFNSTQQAAPSKTRYTSGMPVPVRFSILFQCDFFGRFFLNDCQRFCSGLGMFYNFPFNKGGRVGIPEFRKTSG